MNANWTVDADLNARLSLTIERSEYAEAVEKQLTDYRKKARIPGFRPGMAPMTLIRKQYEGPITADEINKRLQDELYAYLEREKIDVLGQPLPVAGDVDFTAESNTFVFELGVAPALELEVSDKVKIPFYVMEPTEKDLDKEVENLRQRYGAMSEVETAGDDDLFYGHFDVATKKGEAVEGAAHKHGRFGLNAVSGRSLKKDLKALAKGDSLVLDVSDFEKDVDLYQVLGFTAEERAMATGYFRFKLEQIYHIEPAALNAELFDKLFGEGVVTDEAGLRAKIKEELTQIYQRDAEQHFFNLASDKLMETKFKLPAAFLKKWMTTAGEKPLDPAEVEAQWPQTEKAMRWQLIETKLVKDHHIHVHREELVDFVTGEVVARMRQFGRELSAEEAQPVALNLLKERAQAEQYSEQLLQRKLMQFVLGAFGKKEIKATYADFVKEVN
ncbi:MAG: trigger factor, partial [Schleiferiaceae bacterium]